VALGEIFATYEPAEIVLHGRTSACGGVKDIVAIGALSS
jgi:hypothetical protein